MMLVDGTKFLEVSVAELFAINGGFPPKKVVQKSTKVSAEELDRRLTECSPDYRAQKCFKELTADVTWQNQQMAKMEEEAKKSNGKK